jgi:ABC-type antimicrobial peptide transport system permease subunit
MIFFEMMPMEGKLVVLGILCIIWHIIYKYFVIDKNSKFYKVKFIFLHSYLGFIGGLVIGLVVSTFVGKIELQTKYSVVMGVIGFTITLVYSLIFNDVEKIDKIYVKI